MPHLTPEHFDALRRLDTCSLANAIETFDVRLRNEGFTRGEVRCLAPRPEPMLGYAVTVRMKSSNPPTGAHDYGDRDDWWDYIQELPTPRVLVIEDIDEEPRDSALFGFSHVSIWKALGCIGAVTDGAIRDLPSILESGFHLYGSGLIPSHGYSHIVDVGEDVKVNGLEVSHGDLVHGDVHGVITIPFDIAAKVPEAAAKLKERDRGVIDFCNSADFTIEKLREYLKLHF